ncbi:uncharacterized protein MELLADRAFT_113485 [Melampsora larici-populina 98AG31]|uniref:Uncharacterized protein n=1 Tax=Melampsora larici-populina (strain 98AG31 / pathotype 3-4-7) TaxID=747676 RepID=F4SA14_MELLP|nr:uncharacterized protein MELLADRAFT_113485 [Melampsora larici-populina 98AG31]EGF98467.1 hypothetical protein MELLADRAFT_113485 [Melampsora larici-populina 98AG31]
MPQVSIYHPHEDEVIWACELYSTKIQMDSGSGESETSFQLDPTIESLPPPSSGETDDLVERICRFMTKQQTSTKKFLLSYLKSSNQYVVSRKKQWGSVKKGWKTTEEILDAIDELAKVIVAAQSPPTGSLYININKLDQPFFDHAMDVKRDDTVIQSMNFIHELISFKLGIHKKTSDETSVESLHINSDSNLESDSDLDSHEDCQAATNSAATNDYHKSKDKAENTQTRLKSVFSKSIVKSL